MSDSSSANRDGEWLYKKWRDGPGMVIVQNLVSVFSTDREDCDPCIAAANRNGMLFAWEAGWAAAGGDDDDAKLH